MAVIPIVFFKNFLIELDLSGSLISGLSSYVNGDLTIEECNSLLKNKFRIAEIKKRIPEITLRLTELGTSPLENMFEIRGLKSELRSLLVELKALEEQLKFSQQKYNFCNFWLEGLNEQMEITKVRIK